MNIRLPMVLALSLAWCPRAAGQEPSLSAVVGAVVSRSPRAVEGRARVEEALGALGEAQALRLPSLSARSGFLRGNDPVYAFGTLLQQRGFTQGDFALDALNHPKPRNTVRSSLELGVPLFTGLEASHARKDGELSVDLARSRENRSVQEVRWQAVAAYLAVLLQGELLASVTERIGSAQVEVESAQRLKASGVVLGSDFQGALSVLSGFKARKAALESGLKAARSRLAVLTGGLDLSRGLKGRLTQAGRGLPGEADLAASALRDREEVRQAALTVELAGIGRERADWSIAPRVDAFAAVSDNTEDFGSHASDVMMGVRMSLPFGDPAYFSRRARARARLEAARAGRADAEDSVRLDALEAEADYEAAQAGLPALREAVDRARESLSLFKPLYRQGRQSVLDVLRAEEGLLRAHAALLEAAHKLHSGWARARLAAGSLDEKAVSELETGLEAAP